MMAGSIDTLQTLIAISRQGEAFYGEMARTGSAVQYRGVLARLIAIKSSLARELTTQLICSGASLPGDTGDRLGQSSLSTYAGLSEPPRDTGIDLPVSEIDDIENRILFRLECAARNIQSHPLRKSLQAYAPQLYACCSELKRIQGGR